MEDAARDCDVSAALSEQHITAKPGSENATGDGDDSAAVRVQPVAELARR